MIVKYAKTLTELKFKPLKRDLKLKYTNSDVQNSHIVIAGDVAIRTLDAKSNEADDSGNPHQTLQTSSQLSGELNILGCPFGWFQLVGAVALQDLLSYPRGHAL